MNAKKREDRLMLSEQKKPLDYSYLRAAEIMIKNQKSSGKKTRRILREANGSRRLNVFYSFDGSQVYGLFSGTRVYPDRLFPQRGARTYSPCPKARTHLSPR